MMSVARFFIELKATCVLKNPLGLSALKLLLRMDSTHYFEVKVM